MMGKGINVFAIADELIERGLNDCAMVKGVKWVHRGDVAKLMNNYDQVWRW